MDAEKNRKKPPKVSDLQAYREKRNFEKTREPRGGDTQDSSTGRIFVIQKHAARSLHYDLRLEADGVLKSWAVPKGPSYDTDEKRLAVQVEDHPLEYADFEGLIGEHQYGAGTVMVWDKGTWTPVGDWEKSLAAGKLKFYLEGRKLKGYWSLVKIRESRGEEFDEARQNWILIKSSDEHAERMRRSDVTVEQSLSVKTGRSMEEIEKQKTAYWESSKEAVSSVLTSEIGIKAPWPESLFPQMATLVSRAPEGGQWLSEIKYDGYRILAWIKHGKVQLTTRRGQNWTENFSSIAQELTRLPVENAILDGEVVVLNPDGTTNLQKLQNFLKSRGKASLVYYVFDLPYFQNRDQTSVPLIERKALLRDLIHTYKERIPSIRYSDHFEGSGERIVKAACGYGVEGIIAKQADSPYIQKRTRYWLKRKCINRQEFVVGGYTEPKGSRSLFGSLLLGYYNEQKKLLYCGNVGTGFNEASIKTVYERLKKLEQEQSPFASPVEDPRRRHAHWIAPRMVVEVQFSNWTEAGSLRQPSFVGIREDKEPGEITRENEIPPPDEAPPPEKKRKRNAVSALPVEHLRQEPEAPLITRHPAVPRDGRGIKLSNPEKVLYPDQGVTKRDLAEYYMNVAQRMLPELVNRPLVIVRCPEGIPEGMRENCFFQKHLRDQIPEGVRTIPIQEKDQSGLYPVVDDVKGLLSLVQLGVLEIHMLGCRADNVDHPDRMIFDLDPSPEVTKKKLIEATFYISNLLMKNGMKPFLKLTGGKGIHVVVPLKPVLTWEEIKKISNSIALQLARNKPDWFVATVSKRRRSGKILVDYLRNGLGASTIVPFSTRAAAGAPIAHPVSESELTEELLEDPLTVKNAADRLKKMDQEPWEGIV